MKKSLVGMLFLIILNLSAKEVCDGLIGCDGSKCFEFDIKRAGDFATLTSTGKICKYDWNKIQGYIALKEKESKKVIKIKLYKNCKASSKLFGEGNYYLEDGIGTSINLKRKTFKFPKQMIFINDEQTNCFR
jgi:hypothetical protein